MSLDLNNFKNYFKDIDLNKVGLRNPYTGKIVTIDSLFEHLNLTNATHPDIDAMLYAIETKALPALCQNLDNILEPVALTLCPEITEIEKKLEELGAIGACMSGSGPTVFGLFTDGNKAIEASTYFAEHGYENRSFATKFYQPS